MTATPFLPRGSAGGCSTRPAAAMKNTHTRKTAPASPRIAATEVVPNPDTQDQPAIRGMLLTSKGATITAATKAELLRAARTLSGASQAWAYYQADLLSFAKSLNPEIAAEVCQILGFGYSAARKALAIGKVSSERRRMELSPTHHWVIGRSNLTAEEQSRWLQTAVEFSLSPRELHRSILSGHIVGRKKARGGFKSPYAVKLAFGRWMCGMGADGIKNLSKPALESIAQDLSGIVAAHRAIIDQLNQVDMFENEGAK